MEKKFNCHNCKHRRSIPGDCHSQCVHPKTGGERNVLESMALSFTGGDPQIDFFAWTQAPEHPGVRLYFAAEALRQGNLIKHALKTYYATIP